MRGRGMLWRNAVMAGALAAAAGGPIAHGQSLTTTFAGNSSSAGNTFDLIPSWPITVTSWGTNISTNIFGQQNSIAIYTRPGTANGFGASSAGWTLFGCDAAVSANGVNTPSAVAVSGLNLRPGTTTGVYWYLESFATPSPALAYTIGPSTDYVDSSFTIRSLAGHGPPAFAGAVFANRIWNGRVDYTPTASIVSNATTLAGGNGNVGSGVTFDVVPLRDVTLASLGVSLDVDPNPYSVSIYYRPGTAAGNAGNSAGWTLIGTDPSVIGAGVGNLSRVNVGGVTLRRGQPYGFYVHKVGGGIIWYSDGVATYDRSDLRIISREGVTGFFSPNGLDRIFNGQLETTPAQPVRTLLTSMVGGNGFDGVFFDVQAGARAIDVTGFDLHTATPAGTTRTLRVYYRASTSVGAENTTSGWILAGETAVLSNGTGQGSALQFGRVTIPAGARYGFYITALESLPGASVVYSNSTATSSNSDLTVFPNSGKELPLFSGSTFPARQFNGRVQYVLTACSANCDGSTTSPVLGAADFSCFLTRFRNGDPYANCDLSTTAPVLGAADFSCYLASFRAGCP